MKGEEERAVMQEKGIFQHFSLKAGLFAAFANLNNCCFRIDHIYFWLYNKANLENRGFS
jgi:hypothetical protein